MTTMASGIAPAAGEAQARLHAFCSPTGPEVFHSVVHHQQIWSADPFDVSGIHAEARELFHRLVTRAALQPPPPAGSLLLLLGESGSGKTHLMRAFRNHVHLNARGYCGYLQMTSLTNNYARYVLRNLLDSLSQPYRAPEVQLSSLMRLSRGVLEAVPRLTPEDRDRFVSGQLDLTTCVHNYANRILSNTRLSQIDPDVLRAFLYLQRNDPVLKPRLLKWLSGDDLSPPDRALIGHLTPWTDESRPLMMIVQLARLMSALHDMPLVLLVDQLEDMTDQEGGAERFRRIVDTLITIAEEVPSSVVVIACLEDYYTAQKAHLAKSKLVRLERDPEPVRLTSYRSLDEIESLVARRVQYLYDEQDLPPDEGNPTFPFTRHDLEPLVNQTTRDVLDFCRGHREACITAGTWARPEDTTTEETPAPVAPEPPASATVPLEQLWNDFHSAFREPILDEENDLAALFAWAVARTADELPAPHWFTAEPDGRMIQVEAHGPNNAVDRLLMAICDRPAPGGGLSKQISEVAERAGDLKGVILRSTEYPSGTAAVSKEIGKLIVRGWRRVVVETADWRRMMAFRAFRTQHNAKPGFEDWVREGRPLTQLPSLREALNLDQLPRPTSIAPPPTKPLPAPVATEQGPLRLGARLGVNATPVEMMPIELCQHAAFVGGSGSGKTTAALNLVEQLLERGIPAVFLDRKGDLCRYADPAAWNSANGDSSVARRTALRASIDVAVFTPGQPNGRPLMLPIVPEGLDQLPTLEREQLAGYAASAIGGMLGYRPRGTDQSKLAILAKAIEVLASLPGQTVTMARLRQLVDDRDEALLTAVGGFDQKIYKKLSEELLTLSLQHKQLLSNNAEPLDVDLLLGRGSYRVPGKTRLSIVSTRFLADQATTEFWVAQLLLALSRWIGKQPSRELQAVFLFDEADFYLPAQRQPATKAPMESLLKRARSAGVGLLLATQSPGDFDYKCRDTIRTWFVGKVKEPTALNKLKPMFAESNIDVAAKLPTQPTGHFFLMRDKEVGGLHSLPSLMTTEQLPEQRILELAQTTKPTGKKGK